MNAKLKREESSGGSGLTPLWITAIATVVLAVVAWLALPRNRTEAEESAGPTTSNAAAVTTTMQFGACLGESVPFSFTGSGGDGDGRSAEFPCLELYSNGNESSERFQLRFEDCEIPGRLDVFVDGEAAFEVSGTGGNCRQTGVGLDFEVTSLVRLLLTGDGSYRVASHAAG